MGSGMIESADSIAPDDSLNGDVAIVGSGAAGIPLALELAEKGLNVILLEAGEESLQARDQAIYEGDVRDPALHSPADKYRQRQLGGSTSTWGGRCVPLDRVDHEPRDYVPNSGWPISYEELSAYYARASEWLESGDRGYRSSEVFGPDFPKMIAGLDSERVHLESLECFSRPTDIFRRYRSRLDASENLRLIYGANVTRICLSEDTGRVAGLRIATHDGKTHNIQCRQYVLAAGGIETARLLLASNDVNTAGVGNTSDNVGRYYMCHVAGNVGELKLDMPLSDVRHGYELSDDGVYCRRRIMLTEEEQRSQQINNVVMRLHFPRIADPSHKSGVLSFIYLMKPFISYEYGTRLRDGDGDTLGTYLGHLRNVILSPLETARFGIRWITKRNLATRKFPSIILENKTNLFSLEINAEQCPRPDSRITLSEKTDALGMPRVNIDWKYSKQDIASVRKTLDTVAAEIARLGIGILTYDHEGLEKAMLRFGAYGGHHIGTARMGTDPATSVVDANCRIHDVENLYVASSAVFPTSSQANPTLAITALAIRLADHLTKNLDRATAGKMAAA